VHHREDLLNGTSEILWVLVLHVVELAENPARLQRKEEKENAKKEITKGREELIKVHDRFGFYAE
jgi:hypothetical protein